MIAPWWRDAIGYEVYIRSFADSDGDGSGDLRGLIDRLDHVADLGVDIVWVTPFYPSPLLDHGYDVADYTAIAPEYGTLADVEALVAAVHERGMRLLVDLVPNHTSSEHPWFRAARSSRHDPHRDYYIWRDPAPDGGPPNNWVSHFGGKAWTYDAATGQYWLHLFLSEQPDLNWRNLAVVDEFDRILRFWLDRGVDGFRIDVAHALRKHPDLPDQPPAALGEDEILLGSAASDWETLEHPYDSDQADVLEVHRHWRAIADEYEALLLGEVYVLEAEKLARYLAGDVLHAVFWFPPLHASWRPDRLRRVLGEGVSLALESPATLTWVQSSHDRSRAVRRYGGGDLGRARALALATMEAFLPGMVFVYQGEELGLDDPALEPAEAQDPIAVRAGEFERTRDVARTPIPWAPGPGMGFTTAPRPWLAMGDRAERDTAAVQAQEPSSPLAAYRALFATRRALRPLSDDFSWLDLGDPVLAFRRGDVTVAANLTGEPVDVDLRAPGQVLFSTDPRRTAAEGKLGAYEAVVFAPPAAAGPSR